MNTDTITTFRVNYHQPKEVDQLIDLINSYASDPMGGGQALGTDVKSRLRVALPTQANMFSLIVQVNGQAAGFCDCFIGFSTFVAAPLINIHDLAIMPEFRGLGLSKRLLQEVTNEAKQIDAVKVTLEVLGNNHRAQQAYRSFGFVPYELSEGAGKAEFWQYYL